MQQKRNFEKRSRTKKTWKSKAKSQISQMGTLSFPMILVWDARQWRGERRKPVNWPVQKLLHGVWHLYFILGLHLDSSWSTKSAKNSNFSHFRTRMRCHVTKPNVKNKKGGEIKIRKTTYPLHAGSRSTFEAHQVSFPSISRSKWSASPHSRALFNKHEVSEDEKNN